MMKLKLKDFFGIYWRSFFIQAVWNYTNLLAIGFCYSMLPVARRLYKEPEKRKMFLLRHLNFFNAHPYFTSFALGAIARIEEEEALTDHHDYSRIERFKNALIGPLGAIGDQLIWALIKPASILAGLAGVILIPDFERQIIFLFVLLIFYNLPHLYIRAYGLYRGYQMGFQVYRLLNLDNFSFIRDLYAGLGAICLGIYTAFSTMKYAYEDMVSAGFFIFGGVSVYLLRRKNIPFFLSILIPMLMALLLGVVIDIYD